MSTQNRLHWIDTIKAICIICVYFAHCVFFTTDDDILKKAVAPFYVNTFFFVSGYLLYKKYLQPGVIDNFSFPTYWNCIKTCIYRIIIPSIIFSSIVYVPKALFHNQEIDFYQFILNTIGGCGFWFTASLAVAQIVIFTLFLTKEKNILFYLAITAGIFIAIQTLCDFTPKPAHYYFPWYWRTGLAYTFIITLGGVHYIYENKINRFLNKGGIILAIIASVLVYIHIYSGGRYAFMGLSGRATTLGIIGAISTTLLLIYIVKRCNSYKTTDFIGRNSIIFYFLSAAVPTIISSILKRVIGGNALLIITLITSIIISYIVTLIINRYLPFLTDIRLLKKRSN